MFIAPVMASGCRSERAVEGRLVAHRRGFEQPLRSPTVPCELVLRLVTQPAPPGGGDAEAASAR